MRSKKLMAVAVISVCLWSCEKEAQIEAAKLPREIRNYIDQHFPEHTILRAERDWDGLNKDYQVFLSNSIQLEFDRKDKIIDIDGSSKLPDSVIPEPIRNYVSSNFPDSTITDWEKDDNMQTVGLNNNMELIFNENGEYIGMD